MVGFLFTFFSRSPNRNQLAPAVKMAAVIRDHVTPSDLFAVKSFVMSGGKDSGVSAEQAIVESSATLQCPRYSRTIDLIPMANFDKYRLRQFDILFMRY